MNKDLLRKLNQRLCDMIDQSQNTSSEFFELLDRIITLLESQNTNLRPILYCDGDCGLTGGIVFVQSEETGELIKIYYDSDFNEVEDPPEGFPCDTHCFQDDYEFKHFETCFTDGIYNYQRITCVVYRNGVVFNELMMWLLPDGTTTTTKPDDLKRCLDDPSVCEPWMGGGKGDGLPSESITDLTLMLGDCTDCQGFVETSIGDIPFYSTMDTLCLPPTDCSYTVTSIVLEASNNCTLDDIIWYASRRS